MPQAFIGSGLDLALIQFMTFCPQALVKVMARCCQATSLYLNRSWPNSMMLYDTRNQSVMALLTWSLLEYHVIKHATSSRLRNQPFCFGSFCNTRADTQCSLWLPAEGSLLRMAVTWECSVLCAKNGLATIRPHLPCYVGQDATTSLHVHCSLSINVCDLSSLQYKRWFRFEGPL